MCNGVDDNESNGSQCISGDDAVNAPDEYRYDSATGLFINDTNPSGMMAPVTAGHPFHSVPLPRFV